MKILSESKQAKRKDAEGDTGVKARLIQCHIYAPGKVTVASYHKE